MQDICLFSVCHRNYVCPAAADASACTSDVICLYDVFLPFSVSGEVCVCCRSICLEFPCLVAILYISVCTSFVSMSHGCILQAEFLFYCGLADTYVSAVYISLHTHVQYVSGFKNGGLCICAEGWVPISGQQRVVFVSSSFCVLKADVCAMTDECLFLWVQLWEVHRASLCTYLCLRVLVACVRVCVSD